ncbi:hypothetical protein GS931_18110 [Rhodococcus hoagii]|nr:hypothetical protein [Prescottella equi]
MATKLAVTSAATTNRVLEALEHGLRNGKLALTEEVTMDVLAECLRSQKRPHRPREGGRAVPSSRASLYRYFRNPIEALLKLERYIVVHDRAVPESLTQYLATHSRKPTGTTCMASRCIGLMKQSWRVLSTEHGRTETGLELPSVQNYRREDPG